MTGLSFAILASSNITVPYAATSTVGGLFSKRSAMIRAHVAAFVFSRCRDTGAVQVRQEETRFAVAVCNKTLDSNVPI